ncbi:MAG: EAL domain-containing protein [Agathobacter sp.]|nr:EAL domain-containing protein [Agathobacter sp.]
MSIFDVLGLGKGEANKDELKIVLMKLMAEQNNEKFLEYDRATDTVVLSEVKDGKFQELEVVEGFVSAQDIVTDRIHETDKSLYRKMIQTCLRSPKDFSFEVRYNVPDLGPRWYRMFILSVADETGYVTKFVARMQNIQFEKDAQEAMRNQAERDSLSGVYNHATYEHLCSELAERSSDGLLFVMVDIDNFKQINDTKGHHAGDKIIQHVGNVLDTLAKGRGYAGRIGGDEFSVCFYDVRSREHAASLCAHIKSAINQYVNTVPFTVSLGATLSNGRKLSFQELYFEADEAVYFSKGNGKNQITFKDEIQEKKKQQLLESKSEYALSEEEIALDQKLDYIIIVDPVTKKLLYVNESARNILGLSLEEAQQMYCYELFKSSCSTCGVCELHTNHAEVLSEEDAKGLHKYIPEGKFILQSMHTIWKGDAARYITFLDVNDPEHVEICAEAMMESQETFSKCWSLILESNSGDTAYEKILRVLTDYYDADCSAIVTKDGEEYRELFEYHRNSAQGVAEGLRISLGQNILRQCEVLLDEEDFMRPRYINEKLIEMPELAEALEKKFVRNTMGIALRKFGEIIGVLMIINPRRNTSDYNMISRIGVFFGTDLVRKKLTDNKTYEEDHDIMTRLWNRGFFNSAWQIDYLPLFKSGIGVFSTDIFHLKEINRQLGYNAGNDRIIEVAELFRKVFVGYSMFRYDDDQILAVCHNVEQKQFQNMVDYAKELIADLDFEVSCGYSWKAEPLVFDAIFEAEEYQTINRQYLEKEYAAAKKLAKKIEKDVLKQIEDGNFRMYLQPKVSISKNKTVGAEALIRLYHPEKGIISPAMFIPVLEKQNEVHLVDLFILRRALQFQKAAKDAGKEQVPISVNFSKNTLMYPKLIEFIEKQCEVYGMPEGLIRIEITETISNMDHIEVRNIAKILHEMGFSISMDDFGTQYSNMAVLTQFDFDTVKIDRSMIMNIVDDAKNRTILKHTVGMLTELGMETIIEGVETEEQVEVLKTLGCDVVQGFFFGRPEPEEKFYELFMV